MLKVLKDLKDLGLENLTPVEQIIKPMVESHGFILHDLEFSGRILRVTINRASGVSIGDCALVSRELDTVLESEDSLLGGKYELEVSSPGMNRILKKLEHFEQAIGERIRVVTDQAMAEWNPGKRYCEGRKSVLGILESVVDKVLTIKSDGHGVRVPFEAVKRAQVDFDFDSLKGKKVKHG